MIILEAARQFAKSECLPGVIERDDLQLFPREQLIKLSELGLMGMMVKPDLGGAGQILSAMCWL